MKIAPFGWNAGPVATPETIARVVRLAEDSGYESLWCGEHVVLPDPQAAPSPLPPEVATLDPTVALTFAAAHGQCQPRARRRRADEAPVFGVAPSATRQDERDPDGRRQDPLHDRSVLNPHFPRRDRVPSSKL